MKPWRAIRMVGEWAHELCVWHDALLGVWTLARPVWWMCGAASRAVVPLCGCHANQYGVWTLILKSGP